MDSATAADTPSLLAMDLEGRIRIPRAGAVTAAILRIGIGLIYLWAFLAQGFGIGYTNQTEGESGYAWHFSYEADAGWISSGFSSSPTEGYVDSLEGPIAFVPQKLPVGLVDFGWMFAIGGLAIALILGVCSRIAGWGGFLLNLIIWFSVFPPANNPFFDAEHFMFAFILLLLMWIQASNVWGIGRWWRSKTPAFLH